MMIEDKIKGKKKVNTLKNSHHKTNFKEDETKVQKKVLAWAPTVTGFHMNIN